MTDKDTHISNASATTFVTNPSDPDIYRGIENRFMCNKSYSTNTSDIITFVGYRTPANEALGLPRLYKEVVSINSKPYQNNFIEAVANYVDNGNGFATELKFVNYTVTAASDKYKNKFLFKWYKSSRYYKIILFVYFLNMLCPHFGNCRFVISYNYLI